MNSALFFFSWLLSACLPASAAGTAVLEQLNPAAAAEELKAAARTGDGDAQLAAMYKLKAAGPEAAVPPLIEALKDPDWEVREVTAWALGHMEPFPASGVKKLIEAMGDKNKAFGLAAAEALADINPYDDLIKELASESAGARGRALYVIGKTHYHKEKDEQKILNLLKDKDEKVRENAIWALGELRMEKADPVPALLGLFSGAPYQLCARVTSALGKFPPERVNPEIFKLLSSPDNYLRRCAALYFTFTERAPAGAAQALTVALGDADPDVRGRHHAGKTVPGHAR